jgi:phosphatidylinositol-3-phosphatase
VGLAWLAASRPGGPAGPLANPSPRSVATVPRFGHVWVIVLENTDYATVVGGDLPYVHQLIGRYGLAEAYHAVARPSQPNYLALFSGSTHGIADNDVHDIAAPTVADQIEASGRSWAEYAENVPPGCFTGASASGGRDGPGEYRRKHAPAISFDAIRTDPTRCASIKDLTAFDAGDTDYALIIPNLCHDAHDCPLAQADRWLSGFVPAILDSDAFKAGGALFVTFDEDHADRDRHGGQVATIVASPATPAGFRSSAPHDHYSLLRTIQSSWSLDCLALSCAADTMAEFFPS